PTVLRPMAIRINALRKAAAEADEGAHRSHAGRPGSGADDQDRDLFQDMTMPPSTLNAEPVVKSQSSDAMNSAMRATDSTLPRRFNGERELTRAITWSRPTPCTMAPCSQPSLPSAVGIGPGQIALTRMSCCAT